MSEAPVGSSSNTGTYATPQPKRIYISYSTHDGPETVKALRLALQQAGYQPVGDWLLQVGDNWSNALRSQMQNTDGAVVLVGPAALDSNAVIGETVELLQRRAAGRFPVVPLLHDSMSPAEIRSSGLSALAGIQASAAPAFPDRIAETIGALDREFGDDTVGASPEDPSPFTATRVITAGSRVAAVALGVVGGRPALVTGGEDATVRIWDLASLTVPEKVFRGHDGPVWSVALGRLHGRDIVVSGGDDRTVRVWAADTGESLGTYADHTNIVNSVAIGYVGDQTIAISGSDDGYAILWNLTLASPIVRSTQHPHFVNGIALLDPADARTTALTACSDGIVRTWSPEAVGSEQELIGHTDSVSSVAAGNGMAFSGSLDGTVRGWNLDTDKETDRFVAHAGGVRTVAVGTVDGVATVVSGGNDSLVRLWDPRSGSGTVLAGHTGPVRSVALGAVESGPIVVSGSDDGTVRVWSANAADQVEWLSDAPSHRDLLRRRPLARVIAVRLRRMNDEEPGTSFLVHIDGPWGAGKSTLVNFLQIELEPDFITISFDAWREAGVGPAWWALLTALRTGVCQERRWPGRVWLRISESTARLRRVGAPFMLALTGLVALAGGFLWLFTPPSMQLANVADYAKTVTGILAAVATVWAGALVASRFLLWDSARGARLFEQSNTNPMLEVARHFDWLMARSNHPVVFLIDDLDRCPDGYVVELLDTVQTLVRDSGPPSAHVVVSADGAWIRTSYELAYEKFNTAVALPGQPLGYLFLDKFFQLRIPVPSIDAPRQQQYLRELLRGPATRQQTRALAEEESRVRVGLDRSVTEAEVVETLRTASVEVRDRVAGAALDKLTTPEAVAATEHSLQRFAMLLPPNPRTMKRFVNAYSAMRAVRTLEGNAVRVESLALWTIIEIRWPSLADHLRVKPESITLVGRPADELDAVPETLHALFSDPALRLLVEFDGVGRLDPNLIRSCCGVSIPETPTGPQA